MTDELVKRHVEQLRMTGGDLADLCQPIADAIDQLAAERDGLLRCVTDNHVALCRAKIAEINIAHLHKLLEEAASDLTAYVAAEYPPDTCAQYPDIARRHHRDMDLVRRIEAELKGDAHD